MKYLILIVLAVALSGCIPCDVYAAPCGGLARGEGRVGRAVVTAPFRLLGRVRENRQAARDENRGLARLRPRNWGR